MLFFGVCGQNNLRCRWIACLQCLTVFNVAQDYINFYQWCSNFFFCAVTPIECNSWSKTNTACGSLQFINYWRHTRVVFSKPFCPTAHLDDKPWPKPYTACGLWHFEKIWDHTSVTTNSLNNTALKYRDTTRTTLF